MAPKHEGHEDETKSRSSKRQRPSDPDQRDRTSATTSASSPISISSDDEDDMCDPQFCVYGNQRVPVGSAPIDLIICANSRCVVLTYHKLCVGRANAVKYPDNTDWNCRSCRAVPPSSAMPSTHHLQNPTTAKPNTTPIRSTDAQVVVPVDHDPGLHAEQQQIVDTVLAGHNVFYTGSAGTGKSTVLKAYVKKFKALGFHVDIIAPSGIAAVNVGGGTFFSYMGCRPDDFRLSLEAFRQKAHGKKVRKRIGATDVLIIDEISMVENHLLTRLDIAMKEARSYWVKDPERPDKRPRDGRLPFGGAQIVITGDYCQLPPVKPFEYCLYCDGGELGSAGDIEVAPKICRKCRQLYHDADKWAFKSPAWSACDFRYFELKHIHRQNDLAFITLLQKCRFGLELTPQQRNLLSRKTLADPVKLMPTRIEVQRENDAGLRRLKQKSLILDCLDLFTRQNAADPTVANLGLPKYENKPYGPLKALDNDRFEEKLELKVGTLVLLLVNLDFEQKLVNGTQGKVIDFKPYDPADDAMQKKPDDQKKRGKSSDPRVEEVMAIKEQQVREFMQRQATQDIPVVDFGNDRIRAIGPCCQIRDVGSEEPYGLLGCTQIPLTRAWAITIHKSQGMTLDRVEIDLFRSFEKEQIYVALSRARSLEGLSVLRMPMNQLGSMNKEVRNFLESNGLLDMGRLLKQ